MLQILKSSQIQHPKKNERIAMGLFAKIFNFHRCASAQNNKLYEARTMAMERQINIYRFVFFIVIMLMDTVGYMLNGGKLAELELINTGMLIIVFTLVAVTTLVHIKTTRALQRKTVYKHVSFVSVFAEIGIMFSFMNILLYHDTLLPIPTEHALIVFSFVIILLNLLGAIRANKGVVVVQTLLLTGLTIWGFINSPETIQIGFYIAGFVFLSGVFSLWVADVLSESFMNNERLTLQNKEIKNASEEIVQQNEEIVSQRDEIEQQRDMVLNQNKGIMDSIRYAFKIQQAVFPPKTFMQEIMPEHFILNRPRDVVSGDFYWAQEHKGCMFVAVADCTGHGVPGAFMSMLGTNMLNEIIRQYLSEGRYHELTPAALLNELRDKVKEALHQKGRIYEMKDGMDMAVCKINLQQKKMEFAGANNPVVIVRKQTNENQTIQLKGDRMPVAIHRRERPFTDHSFQLQTGDMLYLFSDGYVDQFGGTEGQKLMIKRFKSKLAEVSQLSVQEQHKKLDSYLDKWKDNSEQIDDVLVMGLRVA